MRRIARLACLVLLLEGASCASASPGRGVVGRKRTAAPTASPSTAAAASAAPPVCVAPAVTALSPDLAKRRDAAIEELSKGHYDVASRELAGVLDARPYDLAAFALRSAADALAAKSRAHALEIAARKPTTVDEVPHGYVLRSTLDIRAAAPTLHLTSKTRAHFGANDWFVQHGIQSPDAVDVHDQGFASTVLDQALAKTFRFPDHRAYVFGNAVVAAVDESAQHAIVVDFRPVISKSLGAAPYLNLGVVFARVVGSRLLVELCAMGVESTPNTPNAFLMAVDMATGTASWITEMRVAGAQSFVVTGGAVVAAAGLTNDRVTVVDIATGKLLEHFDIPFGPLYVVSEGRDILVEGGDAGEAVFHADNDFAPAPAASIPSIEATDAITPWSAEMLCELRRAVVALDARDGATAALSLAVLPEKDAVVNALRGTADFLRRSKEQPELALDLTSTTPLELSITDAARPAKETLGPPPVLRKLASRGAAVSMPIDRDGDLMPLAVEAAGAALTFPLPDTFGDLPLSGSSSWPSGNLVYYGPKYVVTLRGSAVEHVFDISELLRHDASSGVTLHLGHMELAGDRLLVSFSHRGPTSELEGQKDFIAAFDSKTGTFLWRSDYLVSTMRFTTRGSYAFSAWGTGSDPGTLFVIRLDTGETVSKARLSPAPYELGWENGELVVQNDGGADLYGLRDAPSPR